MFGNQPLSADNSRTANNVFSDLNLFAIPLVNVNIVLSFLSFSVVLVCNHYSRTN